MKLLSSTFLGFLMLLSVAAASQDPSVKDFDVPKKVPKSEKEFKKSEPDFMKAVLWLETTPIDTTTNQRVKMNAWVLMWISDCPYITVSIKAGLANIFQKNSHLMLVWIGGYAKYCIENNSKDDLKANTAGIRSAINCYKLGGQVIPDDAMQKVIDADKEGKLEDWVKEAMGSK